MKNVFKKTVALVSAMSLMAVGTAVSVSASATEFELEIQGSGDCVAAEKAENMVDGYNVYYVQPGAQINLEIRMEDCVDKQFDTIMLRTMLGGLNYVGPTEKFESVDCMTDKDVTFVQFIKTGKLTKITKESYEVMSYVVEVPADAKEGAQYKVEWADEAGYDFTLQDSTVSEDILPHSTVNALFIVGDETPEVTTVTTVTTPAPTTTTTTTALTTVTTTEATTSEAPVTTVAETTTVTSAKSTTKVSVSMPSSSPATGSSSNGVAALAVTMVAAAGAAITLKKKKD